MSLEDLKKSLKKEEAITKKEVIKEVVIEKEDEEEYSFEAMIEEIKEALKKDNQLLRYKLKTIKTGRGVVIYQGSRSNVWASLYPYRKTFNRQILFRPLQSIIEKYYN